MYADILGYKNALQEKSVNDIRKIIKNVIDDIRSVAVDNQRIIDGYVDDDSILEFPERIENCLKPYRNGKFGYYFAFDTILFYWKEFNKETFSWSDMDHFLNSCSIIFLSLFLKYDLLIRGVIRLSDDYYIDSEIFILKDIDKAFSLEKEQEWGGIIMDVPYIENQPSYGKVIADPFRQYVVPFKVPQRKSKWRVLNPININTVMFIKATGVSIKQKLKDMNSVKYSDGSVEKKIVNTSRYLTKAIETYEYFLYGSALGTGGYEGNIDEVLIP